jgi:hypothetical protein
VCAVHIVGVHPSNGVIPVVGIVHIVRVVRRAGAEGGGVQVRGTIDLVRIINAILEWERRI